MSVGQLMADLRADELQERVQQLESALDRMVKLVEQTIIDSEGRHPAMDAGCIDCTHGTVPRTKSTGPCPLHKSKRLLGML